jgi:prepilin-type N-terminal cleavage/methylation domain-containing protein
MNGLFRINGQLTTRPRATSACMLRFGFTIVEVLVVIGIIGTLAALAIPAVQRARAAAGRARCADNLRQLGLALHGYHETFDVFPPGMDYQAGVSPYLYQSWHAQLLPYIDQQRLWEQTQQAFQEGEQFSVNPPHIGLNTVIPAFGCPMDERTRYAQQTPIHIEVALTSYLGIAGTDYQSEDGMLFTDSSIRLSDVVDGTSNTLFVGERPPSADLRLGWWYAGLGQDGMGSVDMFMGVRERNVRIEFPYQCPGGPFDFGPGDITNQCDAFHFWSLHPGGAHFVLVDGSVHFIAYSAAPFIPALATRAGGEATSVP